ncbi:uncharacterized protein LOC144450190 isoform X2 [Glandiceps talaboti]
MYSRYEEAFEMNSRGKKKSRTCSNVSFPNHPQRKKRRPCGAYLMKKVRGKNGGEYLYPKRLYCYRSVKDTLQELLKRPGFREKCQQWTQRQIPEDILADVYDGRIWQEFMTGPDAANTFAVMLNVDWFQPYKHVNDSVGVIYLVIQNLPRDERFKPENVVLVGVIPGPSEPKRDINSYLDPLVDELLELNDGVPLEDTSYCGWNIYSMILLSLSCDIPACRKCGGFLGHGAKRGCSKCLRIFERTDGFGSKADYSGFNPEEWEPRSNEDHKRFAEIAKKAKTKTERDKVEKQYGARFSSLFRLPYYDAIRFCLVDPMHNLLLGTAKHVLKVWKKKSIITDEDFEKIQKRVDDLKVPSDIGRIPSKIGSGFASFTADQWKNWTCVYSLFALDSIVTGEHLDCWKAFVHACRIICNRTISKKMVHTAHTYLRLFCKKFEKLYGPESCTPNLHLHMHLKDCLLDYGPVYSFWLFSCERYNGIMGGFPTNNHSIEIQLMRKFLQGFQIHTIQCNTTDDIFNMIDIDKTCKGTLLESGHGGEEFCYEKFLKQKCCNFDTISFCEDDMQKPLPPIKPSALDQEDVEMLKAMYDVLYPSGSVRVVIRLIETFRRVLQGGQLYYSSLSRDHSLHVVAQWFKKSEFSGLPEIDPSCDRDCVGFIVELFRSEIILLTQERKSRKVSHIIARVKWLKRHPKYNFFGGDTTVWYPDIETMTEAQFIPLERIQSRCAMTVSQVQFPYQLGGKQQMLREKVAVVIPLKGVSI